MNETDAAETPLFTCEYTYSNELISDFARLQTSGKRRGVLLICGCVLVAVGAIWLCTPQSFHWLGLVPIAFGIYCIWYRSNMYRIAAKKEIRLMDADERVSGGRWRRVDVDEAGLTVTVRDGRTQRYDFCDLTNFEHDDLMYVAIFGTAGVALPRAGFTHGSAASFAQFLTKKLYPAGSMGPDTPNR